MAGEQRAFLVVWALTVATLVVNVALVCAYYQDLSRKPRGSNRRGQMEIPTLYTGPFAMIVYRFR
jgi:hypothetical protein